MRENRCLIVLRISHKLRRAIRLVVGYMATSKRRRLVACALHAWSWHCAHAKAMLTAAVRIIGNQQVPAAPAPPSPPPAHARALCPDCCPMIPHIRRASCSRPALCNLTVSKPLETPSVPRPQSVDRSSTYAPESAGRAQARGGDPPGT